MHAPFLTPRRALVLLALLTLATLALRLVGIDCGLPHHCEPDSVLVTQAAWLARPPGAGLGPMCQPIAFYPRLLGGFIALCPGHSYPFTAALEAPLAQHLAAAGAPFLKARIVIAALSVLAIPATFLLARRFFTPGWSLVAALFSATSLLATNYAQQARPHAAMGALIALGLVAVLRLCESGSFATYLVAGLGAALALAGLHNGACVVLALCAAQLVCPARRWWPFALALALVAAATALSYDLAAFTFAEEGGVSLGGQVIDAQRFDGTGFASIASNLWGYEPVMIVLGLALLAYWGARKLSIPRGQGRALLVILVCFAPMVLFWGMRHIVEARFFVPFVPALALAATGGVQALARSLGLAAPASFARRAALASLVIVALLPQGFASVKLVVLRSHGESLERAGHWLEANADRQQDPIGLNASYSLPLFARRGNLARWPINYLNPWEQYQLALPGEPAEVWDLCSIHRDEWWKQRVYPAEGVADFAREKLLRYAVGIVATGKALGRDQTAEGLRLWGEPVFALYPYDLEHTELNGSAYELGTHALERVLVSNAWGHPLEITRAK